MAQSGSRPFDALAWRMAEMAARDPLVVGDTLDLAFTLDENTHPDFGGLQLIVDDFSRAAASGSSRS